jgi:crotonobetainyl-CoA:carnitine CoA-transferase CaiB-like acyl-CoA transferase
MAVAAGLAGRTALPAALSANLERLRTALRRDHDLDIDPAALVWERAETLQLGPPPDPQTSRSGASRLLATRDGWIALTLSRPWDLEALAAWMGEPWSGDPWRAAAAAASQMTGGEATERAGLLGMAAAVCGAGFDDEQARSRDQDPLRRPWLATPSEAGEPSPSRPRPLVVDLSALWAGPLAGRLLAEWGAEVIKVEDPSRPDGLGEGATRFYERLNGAKSQSSLSLDRVIPLMEDADVVITSGRPRVWERLGVPPLRGTWVRITGYGSTGPWRNRVAFGDDAAIAGGLVATPADGSPGFVGDAIADPLTGIMAAAAALTGLEHGVGQVIDVAMREVAGWLGRPGPKDR